MLKRFLTQVTILVMLSGVSAAPALAQWVKDNKPTPKSAEEYYAERALVDASRITSGDGNAVVIQADLDEANSRLDAARSTYQSLCKNRELPKDQWARNCFELGNMYRRGLGVTQSHVKANALYNTACFEADNTDACMQLAYGQQTGTPVRTRPIKPDPDAARTTYAYACELDHQPACAGLGNMLYSGIGGKQDRRRGAQLMYDACESGYEWACTRLTEYGPLVKTDRY